MTKFSNSKLIWFGLFIILILIYFGVTYYATQVEDTNPELVKNTNASQPQTEIIFQPNELSADLVTTYDIDILAKVNAPPGDLIDYINLKLEYDPVYLKILKIQDGEHPGIYQNTLMLNDRRSPIGAISVVWAPINDQGISNATVSLGRITIEPLAKTGQGINISSLNNVDNWLSNVVETSSGDPVKVESEGLSINGGSTELRTKVKQKNECPESCGEGDFCINGSCETLAYLNSTPSNVLGASTDGINSCQTDNDCIKTSTSCCECERGGSDIAININKLDEYKTSLNCNQGDYTCLDYNLCTNNIPVCENNLCTLKNSEGMVLGSSQEVYDDLDLNQDSKINLMDLNRLTSDIKVCERSDSCIKRSDINNDGEVTVADFYQFIESYSN